MGSAAPERQGSQPNSNRSCLTQPGSDAGHLESQPASDPTGGRSGRYEHLLYRWEYFCLLLGVALVEG